MKPHKITIVDYHKIKLVQVVFWSTIVFFYAPIITLIAYSFNDSRRNIVWRGFTFKYYEKAFNNLGLIEAFSNSLLVAFVSTVISLVIGFFAAYGLWRFNFRLRSLYEGTLSLPIVIPEIAMGVSLLAFFNYINWPTNWVWPFNLVSIIIGHVTFSFPFVAVIVKARLNSFNLEFEEAGMDLCASRLRILFDIVIPFLKPALISGAVMAFTLSLDDFVITFFISGPNTVTFPIKVYSMVRFSVSPEVNAISTVMIVITFLLAGLGLYYQGKNNIRTD